MLLLVRRAPSAAMCGPVTAGGLEGTKLGPRQRERVDRIGPAPPAPKTDSVRAYLRGKPSRGPPDETRRLPPTLDPSPDLDQTFAVFIAIEVIVKVVNVVIEVMHGSLLPLPGRRRGEHARNTVDPWPVSLPLGAGV